jgi:RNA polymerase sigma-70 factor (ECF subfamily)
MKGTAIHANPEVLDAQLVEMTKRGDQSAFDELVLRHRPTCVNLATSILRDRGEAEEEAQNACLKAFLYIDQFRGEADFSTWLLRIVENQCLMLIRRRRRAEFVPLYRDSERGDASLQLPARDPDPEGELGAREVIEALKTEIRRVPPLLRNAILMRDVQELPMSDMADQLGISIAAAKSRLQRARAELRQRMLRHCTRSGSWTLLMRAACPPERVFHHHA